MFYDCTRVVSSASAGDAGKRDYCISLNNSANWLLCLLFSKLLSV